MGGVSGSATVWLNLKTDSSGFSKGLKDAGKQMTKTGKQMTTKVTLPVLAFGSVIVLTASKFEKSMNRVRALTGATGEDFELLNTQAKDLGRTTAFSASQAAEGMGFLAQAGFEVQEIYQAMPAMLDLAASAQMDLASTADIASNIMQGFGIEADETRRVADVLAMTFSSSNVNLSQLSESMKFAAPIAKTAGLTFEETAAAVGVLGNAGIQGSQAGTGLTRVITKLADQSGLAVQALSAMGIATVTADGDLRSLTEIFSELGPMIEDMGGAEKVTLFTELFDLRAAKSGAVIADVTESMVALGEANQNAEGTAKRIADIQLEGFAGSMVKLKSASEGFAIAIADSGLLEALTGIALALTPLIQKLAQADPKLLQMGVKIALIAAAVGPALVLIGNLVTAIGTMIPIIGAAGVALSGPWGIAIALIVAGVALVIANWDSIVAWWQTWGPKLGAQILEVVQPIVDWWVENWPLIKKLFVQIWDGIKVFWSNWGPAFLATFKFYWNIIKGVLQTTWNGLKLVIKLAVEIIGGLISFWLKVLTGDWKGAWAEIKETAVNVWNILKEWFGEQLEIFVGFWSSTGETIKELWSAIWSGLLQTAKNFISKIGNRLSDFWKFITGGFDDTYEEVEGGSIWPDMWKEMLGTTNWYAQLIEFRIAAMTQYMRDNLTKLLDGMVEYNEVFQAVPVGTRDEKVWEAFAEWKEKVEKVNAIDTATMGKGRWQKLPGGGYQFVDRSAECGPGG